MSTAEIIASEVRELEPEQQSRVLRFLQALRLKKESNKERASSLDSETRGMESEPDLYSEEALAAIPVVSSREWQGKRMGVDVALSSEVIAAAVRADRDAR